MGFGDIFKNVAKGFTGVKNQVIPWDGGKTFKQPLNNDQRLQQLLASSHQISNGGDTEYIPSVQSDRQVNPAALQMNNGNGVPLLSFGAPHGLQSLPGNIPMMPINNGYPQLQGSYNGRISPDEQFSLPSNYSNGALGGNYLQPQTTGDALQFGDAWRPEQIYQQQLQHPILRRNF